MVLTHVFGNKTFDNNHSFYLGGVLLLELTLAKSTYPSRQ